MLYPVEETSEQPKSSPEVLQLEVQQARATFAWDAGEEKYVEVEIREENGEMRVEQERAGVTPSPFLVCTRSQCE